MTCRLSVTLWANCTSRSSKRADILVPLASDPSWLMGRSPDKVRTNPKFLHEAQAAIPPQSVRRTNFSSQPLGQRGDMAVGPISLTLTRHLGKTWVPMRTASSPSTLSSPAVLRESTWGAPPLAKLVESLPLVACRF
mmetsp:Transcript_20176/g.46492  ORF Transcript_20176/g.46492 Transcript_20176/m.46492 type:complete len:137 (+) Transcript_20176:1629-2039(+)